MVKMIAFILLYVLPGVLNYGLFWFVAYKANELSSFREEHQRLVILTSITPLANLYCLIGALVIFYKAFRK